VDPVGLPPLFVLKNMKTLNALSAAARALPNEVAFVFYF
jgi:hypothetical protein